MRTLLALLMTASIVTAAEPKPAVEVRVKSVRELSEYFEYFGGLAGQAEQGKQFAEVLKAFGGKKGVIEGVDLTRPIGGYVVVSPAVVDSQIIVMLPVVDEKAFVGLLKDRLSLEAKDQGEGVWKMTVPKVPPPVFFRLHEQYACFTIMDGKQLDPKGLIDPKTFFSAQESAIVAVDLHIDRLPGEVVKVVLAQMELALNDRIAKMKDGNANERLGHFLAVQGLMPAVKCMLSDARTLSLRFDATPAKDDLTLALSLSAKDGSDLAKIMKGIHNKPAHAALAANTESPILSVALNAGAPESMKKELAMKIDEVINEAAKNAGGDREAVSRILDAFAPTFKDGDYELGLAITGPDDGGKLGLVAAVRAKDGTEIKKLAKEFASFIPEGTAKFEFDQAKIPGGNVHKITVSNDDLKRIYGRETVWAGVADKLYAVSFEEKGDEVKRIANLKPGTSDLFTARVAWVRFQPLVDPATDAKMIEAVASEVFGGKPKPGDDELKFRISGGEKLNVSLNVKGKVIEFLTKLDQKKKEK